MRPPATKSIWKARIWSWRPRFLKGPASRGDFRAAFRQEKNITLLPRGANIVLSAEIPTPEWTGRLGKAPDIYSAGINHWLLKAALWILRRQPELGIVYVHTTDYPMHMW